jgi:hypothetical protein
MNIPNPFDPTPGMIKKINEQENELKEAQQDFMLNTAAAILTLHELLTQEQKERYKAIYSQKLIQAAAEAYTRP